MDVVGPRAAVRDGAWVDSTSSCRLGKVRRAKVVAGMAVVEAGWGRTGARTIGSVAVAAILTLAIAWGAVLAVWGVPAVSLADGLEVPVAAAVVLEASGATPVVVAKAAGVVKVVPVEEVVGLAMEARALELVEELGEGARVPMVEEEAVGRGLAVGAACRGHKLCGASRDMRWLKGKELGVEVRRPEVKAVEGGPDGLTVTTKPMRSRSKNELQRSR